MGNKLLLATGTTIPAATAESVHIMMQSEAFASQCDFTLLRPLKWWRPREALSSPFKQYGLKKGAFSIASRLQIKPMTANYLASYLKSHGRNISCVYCRDVEVAQLAVSLGYRAVLEQHEVPSQARTAQTERLFAHPNFIGLVVITHSLKDIFLKKLHLGQSPEARILVAADAVSSHRFTYADNLRHPLRLGYIGSLFEGKGYEVLKPLSEITSHPLCVYGNIPAHLDTRTAPRIDFKGYVPYADVPRAMDSFDVGLLPNQPAVKPDGYTDIGGVTSPMKLFEYMAAGKIVLASDLPVIREVIQDGVNGFLVPHDNAYAWAEKVTWMENNRKTVEQVRAQAHTQAQEQLSYDSRARRLLEFIGSPA